MRTIAPPKCVSRVRAAGEPLADFVARDGTPVHVRLIAPSDEASLARFHKTLSGESVYFRYFSVLPLEQRVAHDRLLRICASDPLHDFVVVAEASPASRRRGEIVAIGRLSRIGDTDSAEFAIIVGDERQGVGLGTRILDLLIERGRTDGLSTIVGTILPGNHGMQHLCQRAGFELRHELGEPEVVATLNLNLTGPASKLRGVVRKKG